MSPLVVMDGLDGQGEVLSASGLWIGIIDQLGAAEESRFSIGVPNLSVRHVRPVENDEVAGQLASTEADAAPSVGVSAQIIKALAVDPI